MLNKGTLHNNFGLYELLDIRKLGQVVSYLYVQIIFKYCRYHLSSMFDKNLDFFIRIC